MAPTKRSSSNNAVRAAVVGLVVVATVWSWSSDGRRVQNLTTGAPRLQVDRATVTVGEVYLMTITGMADAQVYVSYSLDGRPMGNFGAYLGADNTVSFQVSESTPKGVYRFLAVRGANSQDWIGFENAATIVVR
jgi:hypothetical protein